MPLRLFSALLLAAILAIPTNSSVAQEVDPVGTWEGKLVIPQGTLRVVFHVAAADDGYTASMDSPDQGANGIPTSGVTVTDSTIVIDVAAVAGKYSGKFASPDLIRGTWSQGPASLDLDLEKAAPASESSEEESDSGDEMAELPYKVENLLFRNEKDDIKLAGTLTIPDGEGPFPSVILVTGSGAQDRDETLLGHKPFRVIADHLTRSGIAVLRYDDRGVGQSEGVFADGTIELFANDAEAAVRYLRTRAEIANDRVGMLGHSEGGIVAPMVEERGLDLAFIVLLAGPTLPGADILKQQAQLIMEANGATPEQIADNTEIQEEIFSLIQSDLETNELAGEIRTLLQDWADRMSEAERAAAGLTEANIEAQVLTLTSPWFRHFVSYDPAPTLAAVNTPVLALFGEKDLQVPSKSNMAVIEDMVSQNGSLQIEARELSSHNHLFQTATTGSPMEYQSIEESISPIALNEISSWINQQFDPS